MLIAISGRIGSGKDTAAEYFCDTHNFTRMSFAAALKDAASVVFGWERELLEGKTADSRQWRETIDPWWANRLDIPHFTPRWLLQYWGTDVCRVHFHSDIWVAAIERRIEQCTNSIVISDCRFANEFDALKRLGGITVRIYRGNDPDWVNLATSYNTTLDPAKKDEIRLALESRGVHMSEYSSVGLTYDYTICNDKTITELYDQLSQIVNL